MHGWIDPFYNASIAPGEIWSDQPIYLPPRHGLKITRVNPEDDSQLNFADLRENGRHVRPSAGAQP